MLLNLRCIGLGSRFRNPSPARSSTGPHGFADSSPHNPNAVMARPSRAALPNQVKMSSSFPRSGKRRSISRTISTAPAVKIFAALAFVPRSAKEVSNGPLSNASVAVNLSALEVEWKLSASLINPLSTLLRSDGLSSSFPLLAEIRPRAHHLGVAERPARAPRTIAAASSQVGSPNKLDDGFQLRKRD